MSDGPAALTLQMVASEKHATSSPRWYRVVDDLTSMVRGPVNDFGIVVFKPGGYQITTHEPISNRLAEGGILVIASLPRLPIWCPRNWSPWNGVNLFGQSVRLSCSVTCRRSAAILAKVSRISTKVVSPGCPPAMGAIGV